MALDVYNEVLVVDDSSAVRTIVRKLLKELGYRKIDEASDGEAALGKILENHYGLVIADWNMEPMNGLALLQEISASKKSAELNFIMMTADTSIAKVIEARHAGVAAFINKPFGAEALKAKISQLTSK
jgi:two-component system chemotaxis response regulator CheY